jgi:hypothetical protein
VGPRDPITANRYPERDRTMGTNDKQRTNEERAFAKVLLALWNEASDLYAAKEQPRDYAAWSGATKDLLLEFGMTWNGEEYELPKGPEANGDE